MKSNSLKTNTLGNWALLFAALLVVSQSALANNQNPKQTPPSPPAKTDTAKSNQAPVQPQGKPTTQPPPNPGQQGQASAAQRQPDKRQGSPNDCSTPSDQNRNGSIDCSAKPPQQASKKRTPQGPKITLKQVAKGPTGAESPRIKQPTGQPSTRNITTVSRGPHGNKHIVTEYKEGDKQVKFVSDGHGNGFREDRSIVNGRPTMYRTYITKDRHYAVVYRGRDYHGHVYYRFVPDRYYAVGFYRWAHTPWVSPVRWQWGWSRKPWYVSSGYYFTPYDSYGGPAYWLTDYVLGQDLELAYENVSPTPPPDQRPGQPQTGRVTGLVYTPTLLEGKQAFAPGFSATGSFNFGGDHIFLGAAATASYAFTVSEGRILTVAYGIPAGGYLNSVPAEISVNGETVASIDKDSNYVSGAITPKQRLLWKTTFRPGRYTLTIRSGGGYVNLYGLWLGNSPASTPATALAPDNGGNQDSHALPPEAKEAIADEVQAQLENEQADSTASSTNSGPAGDQVPAALDPKHLTFIVSAPLSEQTADHTQCSLSPGDVLTRTSNIPDTNQAVPVLVTGSQKDDCSAGSTLKLSIQDLQDMHNDFAQKMDAGLQELAANQGKQGMPSSPEIGEQANLAGQAKPDPNAASALQQQQHESDSAENKAN